MRYRFAVFCLLLTSPSGAGEIPKPSEIEETLLREAKSGVPVEKGILSDWRVYQGLLAAMRGDDSKTALEAALVLGARGVGTHELVLYATLAKHRDHPVKGEAVRAALAKMNERMALDFARTNLISGNGEVAFEAAETLARNGYFFDPRLKEDRIRIAEVLKEGRRRRDTALRAGRALGRVEEEQFRLAEKGEGDSAIAALIYEGGPSSEPRPEQPPMTISQRAELWRQTQYLPALRNAREAICAAPGKCKNGAIAGKEWTVKTAKSGCEKTGDAVYAVGEYCKRKVGEAAAAAVEPMKRSIRESLIRFLPVPQ